MWTVSETDAELIVINEDGTDFNPPKNPLADKWSKSECSHPTYHCMYCDKCHHGDYFEVPDEDKEEYAKYLNELSEYNKIHNPLLQAIVEGV